MEIEVGCIDCCEFTERPSVYNNTNGILKNNLNMIECNGCHLIRVYKLVGLINEQQCRFIKFLEKTDAEYIIWKLT